MLINIAVIVSLCSSVSMDKVRAKVAELQKQHPEAKVSVRTTKKCEAK